MVSTTEEKILELLASMSTRMDSMESGLNARIDSIDNRMELMQSGLTARMDSMETGLNARMDSIDNRIDSIDNRIDSIDNRMEVMESGLTAQMDSMDNRMTKLEFKIETDIETKLDALAEGHTAILEQLTPRTRFDDMEEEIRLLKLVVRQMGDDLQLLKKAQ